MIITQPESGEAHTAGPAASTEELRLVEALRSGDEAAFATLLDRYHNAEEGLIGDEPSLCVPS